MASVMFLLPKPEKAWGYGESLSLRWSKEHEKLMVHCARGEDITTATCADVLVWLNKVIQRSDERKEFERAAWARITANTIRRTPGVIVGTLSRHGW